MPSEGKTSPGNNEQLIRDKILESNEEFHSRQNSSAQDIRDRILAADENRSDHGSTTSLAQKSRSSDDQKPETLSQSSNRNDNTNLSASKITEKIKQSNEDENDNTNLSASNIAEKVKESNEEKKSDTKSELSVKLDKDESEHGLTTTESDAKDGPTDGDTEGDRV